MGGSSSTESRQIPDYLTDANKLAISRINQIYEAGRMPYTGIDVVAINPAERAAMDQANMAAAAFGMPTATADPFSGMDVIESGGLRGYSSYPIYLDDMKRLKEQRPDQYAALARQSGFDPITGQALAPPAPVYTGGAYYGGGGDGGGGSTADAIALHHAIHGTGGTGSLLTGRPSAASRAVFSKADLMGNHGGSYVSKIKSDIGKIASGGGVFGAIGNALSGKPKDPTIGNLP